MAAAKPGREPLSGPPGFAAQAGNAELHRQAVLDANQRRTRLLLRRLVVEVALEAGCDPADAQRLGDEAHGNPAGYVRQLYRADFLKAFNGEAAPLPEDMR